MAKGKYIYFVDPDDFIELNTYKILYNLTKKYDLDMIAYKYNNFYPNYESEPKIIKLKKENLYFGDLENYVFNKQVVQLINFIKHYYLNLKIINLYFLQ